MLLDIIATKKDPVPEKSPEDEIKKFTQKRLTDDNDLLDNNDFDDDLKTAFLEEISDPF